MAVCVCCCLLSPPGHAPTAALPSPALPHWPAGLQLYIHIVPDKTNNTLTLIDSGIGMTKVRLARFFFSFPLLQKWK